VEKTRALCCGDDPFVFVFYLMVFIYRGNSIEKSGVSVGDGAAGDGFGGVKTKG